MNKKSKFLIAFDVIVLTSFLIGSVTYMSIKWDSLVDNQYNTIKDNDYPIGHKIKYGTYNSKFVKHRFVNYSERWYQTGNLYYPNEHDKTYVRLS
jgi:hypothetical protein